MPRIICCALLCAFFLIIPPLVSADCIKNPPRTPLQVLYCGLAKGDVDALAAARDKGASVNGTLSQAGLTAANTFGSAADAVLKTKADVSAWPALTWAVYLQSGDAVRVLIKSGAMVNAVDREGATALHWAAWTGNYPITVTLLENGANPHLRDASGRTPKDWAYPTGQVDILRLLPEPVKVADSDGDGVPDAIDQCPNTPKGAVVDERGCWVVAYDSFFDSGQATLKRQYQGYIQKANAVLRSNPDLNVEVVGHTDSVGSEQYNLALGMRRAEAVRNSLVSSGIPAQRLKIKSMGKSQPIADNATAAGRAKNRRVEIWVSEPNAMVKK